MTTMNTPATGTTTDGASGATDGSRAGAPLHRERPAEPSGPGGAEAGRPRRDASALLAKYVLNPVMRPVIRAGLLPSLYALVETTGRRSGRRRVTPVGYDLDGDTAWFVAERGTSSDYVRNLVADPQVRLCAHRRWRAGTAAVLPHDDGVARRREFDRRHGILGRLDGVVFRSNATDPLTIRIDLEPAP